MTSPEGPVVTGVRVDGRPRARLVPAYTALVVLAAPMVLVIAMFVHRPSTSELPALMALLALGAASARLRDVEGEAQIDLSFTAAILLAAIPLAGPVGAGLLGALIPLMDLRARGAATLFNSAMTSLVGSLSGLAYLAIGGWVPVADEATGRQLLANVALPLVAADLVLCVVNAAVVGVMIWLHEEPGWRFMVDPFLATLPLYLGYALIAFLFVLLWGQGGLGLLAVAFTVAPLLVARWAYVQYIAESRARQRILDALVAAGQSMVGAAPRAARIAAVLRVFESRLELPRRTATALRYAASLHDIGTVAISRETVGRSAAELTEADWRSVRSHPMTGFEAVRDIGFLEEAAQAVRHHHERWDGSGYPDGLAAEAIPLPARVLAIVDAYEALAWPESDPAHRATDEAALAEIVRRSGRDFDPRLVEVFRRSLSAGTPEGLQATPDAPDAPDSADDRGALASSGAPGAADTSVVASGEGPRVSTGVGSGVESGQGQGASVGPVRLRHAHPAVGDQIAAAQRRGVFDEPMPHRSPSDRGHGGHGGHGGHKGPGGPGAGATGAAPTSPAWGGATEAAPTSPTWGGAAARTPFFGARLRSMWIAGSPELARMPAAIGARWLFASLGLLLLAVIAVQWDRPQTGHAEYAALLIFFATLVLTERFRIRLVWRLQTAPTAAAAGIALALTTGLPGSEALHISTGQVLGVVVAAQAIDWFTARRNGPPAERREAVLDAGIRLGSVAVISVLMRDVPWPGGSLARQLAGWPPWLQALTLTLIVAVVLLAETPVRALVRARAERSSLVRETIDEIIVGAGLGVAVMTTAVALVMTERVLGLAAIPLLLLPLSVSQLAFRRYAQTRHAYRQIVRALSRLPELAGRVPQGHAGEVADLAVGIGVRLGLRERELVDVESAAMLHDIGQLGLRRPLPRGATVLAAAKDQERIAARGAAIVEQAGTPGDVADIVRRQAVPYHRAIANREPLPIGSRIVKVANAYVDYLADDTGGDPAQTVERLYLGLGHEFDPRVVRACEALVTGQDPPEPPAPAAPMVPRDGPRPRAGRPGRTLRGSHAQRL